MGRGRAFALVSLRSAVSAARQAYVVHPWDRACIGCHVSTATLHAECHVAHCMAYYMATATDVWRLPRGMSYGDCHVAYYMATATWHDVWRMLYGSTEFMQCCSALLARPRRAVPAADRLLARATISDRSGPGRLRTASRQAAVCVCFCRHRACVNPDACVRAAALLPLGMHL